jgi:hypothetical protein
VSTEIYKSTTKFVIIVLALLSLSGCASIPLGTMLKLARFDMQDLQKVDPAEIRAAIRTHHLYQLKHAQLSIKIGLAKTDEMLLDETFELDRLPDWAPVALKLKPPPQDRHWIVFQVQPEDLTRFNLLQKRLLEVSKVEGQKSLTLGVSSRDNDNPDDMRSIPFRVDLRLAEADGFFTLIKETEIEIDQQSASQ